jgi:Tol biopolymer transport system component
VLLAALLGCEPAAPSPFEEAPRSAPVRRSTACPASEYPIVFSSDRTPTFRSVLFLLEADGMSFMQLSPVPRSDSPVWSPDGQVIAFRQRVDATDGDPLGGSSEIALFSISDETQVTLVSEQGSKPDLVQTGIIDAPSFAADGETLAFASQRTGRWALWGVSRTGGLLRELLPGFAAPQHSPAWSPRAPDELAFVALTEERQDLWRVDLSRPEAAENLTFAIPEDRLTNLRSPRWSPDGSALAFVADDGAPTELGGGDPEVYVLELGTGALQQLTDNSGLDLSPAWSPDGTQVLVSSNRTQTGLPGSLPYGYLDLWLLNLDDTATARRLTDEQGVNAQADWFGGATCGEGP